MFANYKYFLYKYFMNYKEIIQIDELCFSTSPALDALFWCIECNTLLI